MVRTKERRPSTTPLAFRVPVLQLVEIDQEMERDHRKERSSFVEPIWGWAWQVYKSVGSIRALIDGTTVLKISPRISRETQEQLYTALEMIFEHAPTAVVDEIGELLTARAGKYGEVRQKK
jgi:hypothetical protein